MKIVNDREGYLCTAKLAYVLTLSVILVKIIIGGVSFGSFSTSNPDISGLSMLLGVVGATYFGRSHTKRDGHHVD